MLPYSEIPGSKFACNSPGLFAACHVFHHNPNQVIHLTAYIFTPKENPACFIDYILDILQQFSLPDSFFSQNVNMIFHSEMNGPAANRTRTSSVLVVNILTSDCKGGILPLDYRPLILKSEQIFKFNYSLIYDIIL